MNIVKTIKPTIHRVSPVRTNKQTDQVQEPTAKSKPEGLEQTRFSVIYADPPWDVANQRGGRGAGKHYELMSLERIKNLPVGSITTKNSVCFLWLSNGIFQEGIDVLEAWGYRPISDFIWIKPRVGLGKYFRYASEKMLLGVRGEMLPAIKTQPNWGFFPVQDHSHKPEEVYAIIERMYPNQRYLELFARRRPPNPDWYVWGNEAPDGSDIVLPDYPVPNYSKRAKPVSDNSHNSHVKED
ncbi:cytosine methyltransferase [Candidatus Saccharibacteria bacterium]|nr:cytosine methyltransferase [Candidatus Saccharibacteria bacterium]